MLFHSCISAYALLSVLVVHEPFHISICISTLTTQHSTLIQNDFCQAEHNAIAARNTTNTVQFITAVVLLIPIETCYAYTTLS